MFAQPSDKVRLFVVMSIRHRDMYLRAGKPLSKIRKQCRRLIERKQKGAPRGDGSQGRVPTVQARRPEFRSSAPAENARLPSGWRNGNALLVPRESQRKGGQRVGKLAQSVKAPATKPKFDPHVPHSGRR